MKELVKQLLAKWSCHHEWELWKELSVQRDWVRVTQFITLSVKNVENSKK